MATSDAEARHIPAAHLADWQTAVAKLNALFNMGGLPEVGLEAGEIDEQHVIGVSLSCSEGLDAATEARILDTAGRLVAFAQRARQN